MSEAQSTTLEEQMAGFDPSNPEALAALEKAAMGEAAPASAEAKPAEVVVEAKKEEPAKQDEKQAEGAASGVQNIQGVQAKDGQHIIPYSVLERERDRATRAEQTVQALAEQLKSLQTGKIPGAEGGEANAGALTEDDLTQLDQDLPGVSKLIRAQMSMIHKLNGRVETLKNEQDVQTQNREQSQQDVIETALLANTDLKAWRDAMNREENPDPIMWNRAADLDAVLREDPAWMDKPVSERFAKVAETVKTLYGAPVTTQPPKKEEPQPDLKTVADAKLKGLPAVMPQSLSDIPGGVPPAQSDIENLENASSIALGQKFLSMTKDQMESYLARFAA